MGHVMQLELAPLGDAVQQCLAAGDAGVVRVGGDDEAVQHVLHAGFDDDVGRILDAAVLFDQQGRLARVALALEQFMQRATGKDFAAVGLAEKFDIGLAIQQGLRKQCLIDYRQGVQRRFCQKALQGERAAGRQVDRFYHAFECMHVGHFSW